MANEDINSNYMVVCIASGYIRKFELIFFGRKSLNSLGVCCSLEYGAVAGRNDVAFGVDVELMYV